MRDRDEFRQLDELDRQIDAALKTYGEPEAGHRLEERVLDGVRRQLAREHSRPYGHWLGWAAGLAAAACVLALVFLNFRPAVSPEKGVHQAEKMGGSRGNEATVAEKTAPAGGGRVTLSSGKTIGRRTPRHISVETAKAEPLPKLDVFPTPAPLDEQTQMLAFFIRRAPPSEVKEMLEKQAQANAPLEAKELEIPPLKPLDEGGR